MLFFGLFDERGIDAVLPDARAPGELTLRGQEPNLRSVQAAILDTFGHLPFNPLTILTHFNRLRRRSSIYLSSTGCCTTATSSTIWVLSSSMSSRTAENARRPAPRHRASRATAIALNCHGTGARQDPALHGHALRHRPFRVSRETRRRRFSVHWTRRAAIPNFRHEFEGPTMRMAQGP